MKMSNITNSFTLSAQVLAAFFERISILEFTIFKFQSDGSAGAYPANLVGVDKSKRKYQWDVPYLPATSCLVSTESFTHVKNAFTTAK